MMASVHRTPRDAVLDTLVAHADRTGFRAHGLHVRIGDETAEHHWTPDVRREVHSIAKGVAVLAVGIAADDGLVDVDAPVVEAMAAALPGTAFGRAPARSPCGTCSR